MISTQSAPNQLHWRKRLVVSVATAAAALDRTPDWIRSQIFAGRLEAVQLVPAGALMIRTESLVRLARAARPATRAQIAALQRRERSSKSRPKLRLVINNEMP
jgi:hypothetical protein